VVGIGTGLLGYRNGIVHGKPTLHEQTDQLRNDHGRMRIIDLDHGIIRQIIQVRSTLYALFQNQLSAIADHKILLIDTQFTAVIIAVIRIKEQCQIFCNLRFIKVNAVMDDGFICCIHIKQLQFVRPVVVTGYQYLIHDRLQRQSVSKRNRKSDICPFQPAVPLHPGIALFLLQMIFKYLTEQAKMIVQSDTCTVVSQCSNGV